MKNNYEEWLKKKNEGHTPWFVKMTPNLHLTVILDKVEFSEELSVAQINSYASQTKNQLLQPDYDASKLVARQHLVDH